jgi:hypothetical protein
MPESYRIDSLKEADLEAAGRFLADAATWDRGADSTTRGLDSPSRPMANPRPSAELVDILRWRLLENPDRRADIDLGLVVRSEAGNLAGVVLTFQNMFVFGGQRLLGLGMGSFYVDPRARTRGFFMFRRFLKTTGVDFFFATTCNAISAQLWSRLGGKPIPGSYETYSLLLHAGSVAYEYALRGRAHGIWAPAARVVGTLASPFLAHWRRQTEIDLQPEADWKRMADLAVRYRDPKILTGERSVEYLRWRYEKSPSAERNEIVRFEDSQGRAGWFVAQLQPDIGQSKIRNYCILDLIYPPTGLDLAGLVNAMAAHYADRADLLYLPRTIAEQCQLGPPKLWRRRNPFATSFIIAPEDRSETLALAADLAPVDGDRFS